MSGPHMRLPVRDYQCPISSTLNTVYIFFIIYFFSFSNLVLLSKVNLQHSQYKIFVTIYKLTHLFIVIPEGVYGRQRYKVTRTAGRRGRGGEGVGPARLLPLPLHAPSDPHFKFAHKPIMPLFPNNCTELPVTPLTLLCPHAPTTPTMFTLLPQLPSLRPAMYSTKQPSVVFIKEN